MSKDSYLVCHNCGADNCRNNDTCIKCNEQLRGIELGIGSRKEMRIGTIEIAGTFYSDLYHEVTKIFTLFKPLKVEYQIWTDKWIFTGECEHFDELKEGQEPIKYSVTITKNRDGEEIVSFCKA